MKTERTKPSRRKDPASPRLALARDLVQRNRRKDALAVLDAHLRSTETAGEKVRPRQEAKVAALLGDYEKKRGRFVEAADYYAMAAAKAPADDSHEWFRPALGQVRALIAQPDVEGAYRLAMEVWARTQSATETFALETDRKQKKLQSHGRVEISPRPLRPSVVATRLGEAFLQAGEWEMAGSFYNESLLINPKGGSRARQALAKIALASNDFSTCESRAHESLLLGGYRAKTLAAWPLLITARARQGKTLLSAEDRAGLAAIHEQTVRARAVLVICKAMRPHGGDWIDLATQWSAREGKATPRFTLSWKKCFAPKLAWLASYLETTRLGHFSRRAPRVPPRPR